VSEWTPPPEYKSEALKWITQGLSNSWR
jgi:hypothetical protein